MASYSDRVNLNAIPGLLNTAKGGHGDLVANAIIYGDGSGVGTADPEKLYFDGSNFCIGTDTPSGFSFRFVKDVELVHNAALLNEDSSSNLNAGAEWSAEVVNGGEVAIGARGSAASGSGLKDTASTAYLMGANCPLHVGTLGAYGVEFFVNDTQQGRITTNGYLHWDKRVGIGVSPSVPFDVEYPNGGNYLAHFKPLTASSPYGVVVEEPSSPTSGYPLLAVTNNGGSNTYFRVESGGGVAVGGAPDASYPLKVYHSTNTGLMLKSSKTSGSLTVAVWVDGNTNSCGSIITNSDSSTTTYNTSSDERLKNNFSDFNSIDLVKKIWSGSYERIKNPGVIEYGMKAQQVYKYYPQAVTPGGEDAKKDPWMLDKSALVGILWNALQKLIYKVEELENNA